MRRVVVDDVSRSLVQHGEQTPEGAKASEVHNVLHFGSLKRTKRQRSNLHIAVNESVRIKIMRLLKLPYALEHDGYISYLIQTPNHETIGGEVRRQDC